MRKLTYLNNELQILKYKTKEIKRSINDESPRA